MAKPRILVVDDDRDVALGASIRLRAAGYDVSTASDGIEGVERAVADPPDAIVLDIRMPRRDGFSVLADLRGRKETSHVPVVVLSANGLDANRTRALNLGARLFLRKPYEPERLMDALASLIPANRRVGPFGAGR